MPPELVNIPLVITDFSAYVVFAQHRVKLYLPHASQGDAQAVKQACTARRTKLNLGAQNGQHRILRFVSGW